jgi:hypothetical protein
MAHLARALQMLVLAHMASVQVLQVAALDHKPRLALHSRR